MGSEWAKRKLGDLCHLITDGAHQSPKSVVSGRPMASVKDLTRFGVNSTGARHISEDDFDTLVRQGCQPEIDDILIAKDGNSALDTVCRVRDTPDYVLLSSVAIIRPNKALLEPEYLKQYFSSSSVLTYLKDNFISGAAIPRVILKDFKQAEVPLPPLPEQKAIAHILGTLDDKIELNRRMNATLEGMAQALFKSWFVDFDPVIDNALAAGNPIPDELAPRAEVRRQALSDQKTGTTQQGSVDHPILSDPKSYFPAAFQFIEELGPIPEGWSVRQLSEIATVTKGKSYKSSELQSSTTALVTLKSFNRGGGYRLDGLKEYSGKYKPEQVVDSGDLIISFTDVTQAADVIGKPAMVIPDERYETLVISLDVGVVRPNKPNLRHFLYQLARTKFFEDWMLSHTSGTTVLHLSKNAFPNFECALPDEELISEFDRTVSPLFLRTVENIRESRALTQLRDTLLPKLISGELRVSEAKQLTKEAIA